MTTSKEVLARAHARVGTVVRAKYRIDKVLGAGGMAIVYEVTHRNQKRFALKMLHVELSAHEDVRRRFLREGYAANIIEHPGAVVVIDDDTAEDGSAYLVMELLDGAPLDELLARNDKRLPAEAVLAAAEQALDVLVAAHAKGIVHRDIKPANLFALRDGTLKVLDFGIARLHDVSASSSQATHTGVMLGTPAYMPPEQARSQASQIDPQTDLWSVGATMFTLLSGANVHQGQTATQILVAAASQKARSVTDVAPWVDARVGAVVAKGVAFEKADRFASAAQMRDAVRKVHAEVFGGAAPSRSALAALVGQGQRAVANPDRFIVPDALRDSGSSSGKAAPSPSSTATTVVAPAVAEPAVTRAAAVQPAAPASGSPSTSKQASSAKPTPSAGRPTSPGPSRAATPWIVLAVVLLGAAGAIIGLRMTGKGKSGARPGSAPTQSAVAPDAR